LEYRALLSEGWRPQEARSVLPNALSSKILVTMNLRSWRHFFLMRTTKEAHPQIRQVVIPLLQEFQCLVPVLFEDIVPESRQVDNISRGR
jgi:thymidylate synthase (FAD)